MKSQFWEKYGCAVIFVIVLVVAIVSIELIYWDQVHKTREAYKAFGDGFKCDFLQVNTDRTGKPVSFWVKQGTEIYSYNPITDSRIPAQLRCYSGGTPIAPVYRIFQDVPADQSSWLWVRTPHRSERNWELSPGAGEYPRYVIEIHLHKDELPLNMPGQHREGKYMVDD